MPLFRGHFRGYRRGLVRSDGKFKQKGTRSYLWRPLPFAAHRRLALIRDLDEKATALQKEIEEHVKKVVVEKGRGAGASAAKKRSAGAADMPPYDLDNAIKRLSNLADDKVSQPGCQQLSQGSIGEFS